jgi:hypothetical protein
MRLTEQILGNEAVISGWLDAEPGWTVWHDDRSKRQRHVPTFVAVHLPSRIMLAVYARPRKLHPSEMPDTSWLPAAVEPVVWHPGMSGEIRSWLTVAVGDPPGAVLTTRDGAT